MVCYWTYRWTVRLLYACWWMDVGKVTPKNVWGLLTYTNVWKMLPNDQNWIAHCLGHPPCRWSLIIWAWEKCHRKNFWMSMITCSPTNSVSLWSTYCHILNHKHLYCSFCYNMIILLSCKSLILNKFNIRFLLILRFRYL